MILVLQLLSKFAENILHLLRSGLFCCSSNHLTVDCGRDYVGILYGGLDQAHRRLVVEISPAVDHEQRVLVVQCCLAELGAADELLDQVLQLRVLGRKTLTLLLDRDGIERCLIIFPIEIG